MPETPRLHDEEPIPLAVPRKPGPRSLQFIWIIPVLAALVGGWLAVKALLDRGPTITIRFQTAEGIEANKTRIKYKDVDIGVVRSISLSDDHKDAIVEAELVRRGSKGFLSEDTRFWVVRPRFSGGHVSGLSTLLAGAYIAADPGKAESQKKAFVGLETPPVVVSDQPGRQFMLSADELGSIDLGSPVYYRSVTAGRVVSIDMSKDGKRVNVGIFLNPPFDGYVRPGSRFWNASGVDFSLGAEGVRLQSESLVTLLLGGIAFETPPEADAQPAADANAVFVLWPNRQVAQRPHETVIETYLMTFDQSVRGLAVGAPVDFRGILVGEVKRIDLIYDPKQVRFRSAVEVHLYPERLRSRFRDPKLPQIASAERIKRFVEHGLRGQLRSANLLTGQLYVALDFFRDAPRAGIDTSTSPPQLPTIKGTELQDSIAAIVKKIEKVPFDKIGDDLKRALENLNTTLQKADVLVGKLNNDVAPELKATLEQARKTLASAEKTVAADSPLQDDLRETLQEVTRAAESLRALVDYLERHPESLIRGKRGGDPK